MKKTSILFVCMGNICRSPAAEAVMKQCAEQAGLDIRVESAGTEGYHIGELPDPRMRSHASRRGLRLESRGRQVEPADLRAETPDRQPQSHGIGDPHETVGYDLVIAMDRQNLRRLHQIAGISGDPASSGVTEIRLFSDFLDDRWPDEVPDPYYGGDEGFELVLDMLFAGCPAILQSFTPDH